MPSGLRLPSLRRLHLSGCRRRAKPSASGSWPRLPGAVSGGNTQPVKETVVKKPADHVTLSAAEGEALIARLAVYAPSRSDCEMLIQVVRWYFWLVWTVQEAKLSLNKLRTLLLGCGPKPPTPSAPEASSVSAPSLGNCEAMSALSSRDEDVGPLAESGPPSGPVASGIESPPTPKGGHRLGTGRLGAEAYAGA